MGWSLVGFSQFGAILTPIKWPTMPQLQVSRSTRRSSGTKLLQVGCTLTSIWQALRLVLPAVESLLAQHAQADIPQRGNPFPISNGLSVVVAFALMNRC